ncbi:MAG TPA: ATP-dependent helicase HrpB [Steroidobacteraceae bacterium]|nr:ATP-dependent helicase HrpB [Steroidobacteraceae bacterium]
MAPPTDKATSNSLPELPVAEAMPRLLQALAAHRNAVLEAPPGAGKSTGIPLFLLAAPWLAGRKIVMLEPRRLAARAVATRMASILGERAGETVGYRTRLENQVSRATRIEVITEGILTRRLQQDPTLEGIGLVIFDEIHERNLQADLALALCLDAQSAVREDLRLLAMSATVDGTAVARLLNDAPIVTSPGRSYGVETRYTPRANREPQRIEQEVTRAIRAAHDGESGDILVFLPGAGEIRRVGELLAGAPLDPRTRVLPLYGDLTSDAQDAALRPAAAGERKVVLATNIAETSLTIEGVHVVIDSGLERRNRFDPPSGMNRLTTVRCSRSSADQRRGRAGRLAPGICIRLWTEGEHASLAAHGTPEILEADLAPLALELAEWGSPDVAGLRWLDPPPPAPLAQARELLARLRAIDRAGRITDEGRAMAALGTHPRLAHMMVRGLAMNAGPLACELAGILSERDLLRPRGRERNADLEARIEALRSGRSPLAAYDVDGGTRFRAGRQRDLFLRRLDLGESGTRPRFDDVGGLVAFAYPDRIAQRRDDAGRYLLANGRGASFAEPQPLSQSPMLAIAELDAGDREARVFLAAALKPQYFEQLFADEIETRAETTWNSRQQAVVARQVRTFGALILDERPLGADAADAIVSAMVAGVRELGLEALPWSRELRSWQARVEFLRRVLPERTGNWPALNDSALAASIDEWLAPYLAGMSRREHLSRINLAEVLHSLLTFKQRDELERLVPTHLTVPSGSRIPIDYDAGDAPTVSVRLQELFGLRVTPSLADGRVPLTLKMLSPAGRPVQVTRDLESFWARGYHEVRKELKGRYPKHYWPDNPLEATPTRRVRPRR